MKIGYFYNGIFYQQKNIFFTKIFLPIKIEFFVEKQKKIDVNKFRFFTKFLFFNFRRLGVNFFYIIFFGIFFYVRFSMSTIC